ncbi:MAG: flavoprotein, partial [Phycisphaerae bacterium]
MTTARRSILVCVCGGIAAYKVCHVVSQLAQHQYSVDVAMTAESLKFVGSLTFEALSGRPVHTDLWDNPDSQDPQHIQLAQKASLILVAPTTANMIGKIAHGLADDLVSTLLLAAEPE